MEPLETSDGLRNRAAEDLTDARMIRDADEELGIILVDCETMIGLKSAPKLV